MEDKLEQEKEKNRRFRLTIKLCTQVLAILAITGIAVLVMLQSQAFSEGTTSVLMTMCIGAIAVVLGFSNKTSSEK